METKKSPQSDLEKQRVYFTEIGLLVALIVVLFAFKAGRPVSSTKTLGTVDRVEVADEIIPVTTQEMKETQPAPPPIRIIDFQIVDNTVDVGHDFSFLTTEADLNIPLSYALPKHKQEDIQDDVLPFADEMPEFPGGYDMLIRWLSRNVKYPDDARTNGIQGKVYVQFVVDKTGLITHTKVAREVFPSLDQEALRVVNNMPKWKPGMHNGFPVRVSYTVPINFKIVE
jgi:protein TonB